MTTRSTLLRGAAALTLAVGLIATTTISPAYAKPAIPGGGPPSQPSLPTDLGGLPSLPTDLGGLPSLPTDLGSLPSLPGGSMNSQDVTQMIVGGLRMAADAAEVVVPLVVDAIAP
jgi:hypothetical protein